MFIWNNATLLPRADLAGSLAAATTTVTETISAQISTSSTSCSNNDVALGAGLGVPLVLALVTILVMSWMLVRRLKTVSQEAPRTIGQTLGQFEAPVIGPEVSELEPSMGQRRFHELAGSTGR